MFFVHDGGQELAVVLAVLLCVYILYAFGWAGVVFLGLWFGTAWAEVLWSERKRKRSGRV